MRSVSLTVGETRELTLSGRGSAGYSWTTELEGPEGVVEVRRRPPPSAPASEPGGPPPATGSLPELLTLEGRAPGRVVLRLELRRSWEHDAEPLERDEIEVVVAP